MAKVGNGTVGGVEVEAKRDDGLRRVARKAD